MLRIKLVRYGKKDQPTWRVIVVEKTKTGKGRVTDYIGNYNPHMNPKTFNLDIEKYEKWIKNGAQPTDSILRLKGKFVDKSKEYQKVVPTKVYKKKKPEEPKEIKKEIKEKLEEIKEEKVDEKAEEVIAEAPVEEKKEEAVEEK